VKKLTAEQPDVSRVLLFGSVASDRALPSSDVDLIVVVDESDERCIDRSDRFYPYFRSIPLGFDIFVYTQAEIEKADNPLARRAIASGIELFIRRPQSPLPST
jgi:predicted nucleotidyltransferase